MSDSDTNDTESTDPTDNASNLTAAVLNTVDNLTAETFAGRGASIGAVIGCLLNFTDHSLNEILDEIARLNTHGEIYQSNSVGNCLKLTETTADGGGLDDETAAGYVESVAHSAEAGLTKDELQKLYAVIEHLRDDSAAEVSR